ncbi:MAG: hypothetical protein QG675_372 [Patescibacteria group bacterium]|jgi:LCP family protein required for cell wall assembly|nr:hypothetical protein [Patescibacteria group bacterium]
MAKKNPQKPDFVYDPLKDKGKKVPGEIVSSDLEFNKNSMAKTHISTDFSDLQKPPKPRWRRIMRIVLIVLGVLAAIAAAIALYLFLKAGKISTNPFDFSSKLKGEDEGRVNILLLGIGDPGHAGETLADTNMVVSINTKTNPHQIAMVSLPRDLQVKIAGDGTGKLNEAHAYGESQKPPQGIETSKETIEETLGIPIHYYVRANFTGLKQAVDAVGGIDINVKEPLIDPEYPCEKNENKSCGIKIPAGQQRMDGATALKYARCRKGTCGDDFGRALRQQEVLTAIREKAVSLETLSNPAKVNSLIEAASNNIKTDFSLRNIQRLQEITKDVNVADITNVVFSLKPNGFLVSSKTSSDLIPAGGNFDDIQKFVANIFELGPIWKEDSKITILNGTTTPGLSLKLQKYLESNGIPITVSSVGNATTKDYTTSKIIDYTEGKKPNTANYLAKLLGVEVTPPPAPVKFPVVDFEVILGADYAASSANTSTN